MDLFKPVKIQMSGQSFADERTDKQPQNPKETQESCQGEKTEGHQEQKQAGRLSKLLARIRGVLSDLPQKVLQVFRRLKRIAGEGVESGAAHPGCSTTDFGKDSPHPVSASCVFAVFGKI